MRALFNGDQISITHYPGTDTFVTVQFLNDDGSALPILSEMTANLILNSGDRSQAIRFPIVPTASGVSGLGVALIPWFYIFTDLTTTYALEAELCSNDGVRSVTITNSGTYTTAPSVSFGGPGSGAAGYTNISKVVQFIIGDLRSTTLGTRDLIITAPELTGTTAAATVTTTGGVTAVAINTAGAYVDPPIVSIAAPPSGLPCVLDVTTASVSLSLFVDVSYLTYPTTPSAYSLEVYASDGYGYGTVYIGPDGHISSQTTVTMYNYYTPGLPCTPPYSFNIYNYYDGFYSITGTFDIQYVTAYKVNTVAVTVQGSGYPAVPVISIYGTPYTAAVLTPTVTPNGAVYTITNHGSGYINPPSVTLEPPVQGSNSTGTASAVMNLGVTEVVITSTGTGYTSAPAVTFAPTGASGVAITQEDVVRIGGKCVLGLA